MTDLSIDTILKHLPHRYPFLFIDKVVSIEKGKKIHAQKNVSINEPCLLYTSPSPRDRQKSRMPSSA